jgi:UDP-N-acetylmuramate--alanine ligase
VSRAGNYTFELWQAGELLGEVALQVPGRHNVANAVAAAALASHAGAAPAGICRGLAQFRGLRRRLESLGEPGGVALIDDFAHHPTEVGASLAAVKLKYPGRRVWCIFQPHQASRTRALLDELAGSLHNAGKIFVADIYRAREPAACEGDVTAADVARRMRARGQSVAELHEPQAIAEFVADRLQPGDVVLTMGAGDIGKIAHDLGKRLREHGANG